jgi:hypothetical protein
MEQALFITKAANLKYFREEFTRIYFGNEFCQKLIPAESEVEEVLSFAEKYNLNFTFVTPYVTNRGLQRLEALILFLKERKHGCEILFNDWGVLQFLNEINADFVPVMGRLLNKVKRGPRIMNILDKVPEETRCFFQGTNLDVPSARNFLKNNGVQRIEFDNTLQGICMTEKDDEFCKSIYMPFVFVSTSRFCMSAGCDNMTVGDVIGVSPCRNECQNYTFTLENPVMTVPLIRKGNSIFYLNDNIPDIVAERFVDRIVVQPEIPM